MKLLFVQHQVKSASYEQFDMKISIRNCAFYKIKAAAASLPVSWESSESEDWHPYRSQLYEGNELTSDPAKQPLISKVPAGIHGHTGH